MGIEGRVGQATGAVPPSTWQGGTSRFNSQENDHEKQCEREDLVLIGRGRACILSGMAVPQAWAQAAKTDSAAKADPAAVYPTAIFPFQERGSGAAGMGEKVSDILFAMLSRQPATPTRSTVRT